MSWVRKKFPKKLKIKKLTKMAFRQKIKDTLYAYDKTWTGLIKHGLIKHELIKHGLIKRGLIKHGLTIGLPQINLV